MKSGLGCVLIASTALLAGCRDDMRDGPMRTGIRYFGDPFASGAAAVIFTTDGRILELSDASDQPRLAGEWMRDGGRFCIVGDPDLQTSCLAEERFGQGGFALRQDGRQIEFLPLAD